MSAGDAGAIGPVSVRYAAQIREMLYAQAVQRMAAEQEAARAQATAKRAARAEAAATPVKQVEPVDVKVDAPKPDLPAPIRAPESAGVPAPATLVDIQA